MEETNRLVGNRRRMSDQIPQPTYRNLCDKLYDKRKQGALEIEQLMKEYSTAKKEEEIKAVIRTLTTDFVDSPQGNNKKGGLIALAAAVIGLGTVSLIYKKRGREEIKEY
jgi:vacuole morphology and inheritance protein 14